MLCEIVDLSSINEDCEGFITANGNSFVSFGYNNATLAGTRNSTFVSENDDRIAASNLDALISIIVIGNDKRNKQPKIIYFEYS